MPATDLMKTIMPVVGQVFLEKNENPFLQRKVRVQEIRGNWLKYSIWVEPNMSHSGFWTEDYGISNPSTEIGSFTARFTPTEVVIT